MNGTARTFGAITVTNALPAGIGCAAGITLPVDVEAALTPAGTHEAPRHDLPPAARTPVVEESLQGALARYSADTPVTVRLALRSEVPVARGLKSSSAVSTAVVLAVARATGRDPEPLEVGRVAAEAGRRAGVSATGALDDALAGLESGFVVTDNRHDELLRRTDIDPNWGVALYVPTRPHPRAPDLVARFSAFRKLGELSARAAMDGDWIRAMHVNTEFVERAMGYSYEKLRARLSAHGAIASGVCGLGPSLASIGPSERLQGLLEEFPSDDSLRLVVGFARPVRTRGGAV